MKQAVWNRVRRKVKTFFERNDLTRCEICGSGFGLTFAHRKKRRFITDEEELSVVALLCLTCHQAIETLPHSQMEAIINQLIEQRVVN